LFRKANELGEEKGKKIKDFSRQKKMAGCSKKDGKD